VYFNVLFFNALELARTNVPLPVESTVSPLKVLLPESVRLPAPAFANPPTPEITLLKLSEFEPLLALERLTSPLSASVPAYVPFDILDEPIVNVPPLPLATARLFDTITEVVLNIAALPWPLSPRVIMFDELPNELSLLNVTVPF
jgi:hypothetical protein